MLYLSKNFGFTNITIDGIRMSALKRHVVIEITTRAPKKRKGAKFESVRAKKPITTDSALKIIPLPDVVRLICAASS